MSGPLDLTHWVTRLSDQVADLKTIGLAGDLQRVKNILRAVPAAWVMPGPESVAATEASAQRRYRMRCQVEIVIAMRHYGDTVGGKATDALRELRTAIGDALIGWQPPDALVTVIPKGGQPLSMASNAMWYRERFETSVWR
jgi:hypothetical protein